MASNIFLLSIKTSFRKDNFLISYQIDTSYTNKYDVKTKYHKKILICHRQETLPKRVAASPDPFYSTANQEYVLKSVKELRDGKGTAHELIEEDR